MHVVRFVRTAEDFLEYKQIAIIDNTILQNEAFSSLAHCDRVHSAIRPEMMMYEKKVSQGGNSHVREIITTLKF